MRTSLNNIAQTEARLSGRQQPADALLFDAKLLLDDNLAENISAQQKVYSLIQQYGRKKLKQEIEAAHQQLFSQPQHHSFRQKIARFFSSKF